MRQSGYAMQRQGLAAGCDVEAASKPLEKCLRQILDLEDLEKKLGLSGKKLAPQFSKALEEADPRAKFVLLIWNYLSNLSVVRREIQNAHKQPDACWTKNRHALGHRNAQRVRLWGLRSL